MMKFAALSPIFITIVLCCIVHISCIRCPFRKKSTKKTTGTAIPPPPFNSTISTVECLYTRDIPCSDTYPYRSYNGSCNNLKYPNWGMAYTPYSRILPGKYSDNIQSPRRSITGRDLPWPRILSVDVFNDKSIPDPNYNLALIGLGKIIAHDMGHNALKAQAGLSQPHSCCKSEKFDIKNYSFNKCFPILIPKNDPNYSKHGIECLQFDRSLTDKDFKCPGTGNKPVNQINAVSHYLDLSLIYGNFKNFNSDIREFVGGRLLVSKHYNDTYDLLPQYGDFCVKNLSKICFRNGDSRANQNPTLLIMETIFLREHNRIANNLVKYNPNYNDEKLFQIARKINIAKYQHIVYYEYLPIVLGRKNLLKYNVIYNNIDSTEYINDYNPFVNPSVTNENAIAAFRFFHSQIRGYLHLVNEARQNIGSLRLSDHINYPDFMLKKQNFDDLTRGMAYERADKTDDSFTKEITLYFKKLYLNQTLGYDLRAIDIQRDRDHGLPTYNDFREACGLPRAIFWNDLFDVMTPENVKNLQNYYNEPDDIDLSVGGGLERHIEDSLVGPTFLCILTEQFYRTRVGDRFFYENGSNKLIRFTPTQLQEIRNANLARLFCDNGNSIEFMQPFVLRALSHKNDLVSCKQIKKVDLSKWREMQSV